jgi:hypothetical protein
VAAAAAEEGGEAVVGPWNAWDLFCGNDGNVEIEWEEISN